MIFPRGPMASIRSPGRAAAIQSVPGPAPCRETSIVTVRWAGSKLADGVAAVHHPVPAQGHPQHQVLTRLVAKRFDARGRQHHPTERRGQCGGAGHFEATATRQPAARPAAPPSPACDQVPCPGGLPGIIPTAVPTTTDLRQVLQAHVALPLLRKERWPVQDLQRLIEQRRGDRGATDRPPRASSPHRSPGAQHRRPDAAPPGLEDSSNHGRSSSARRSRLRRCSSSQRPRRAGVSRNMR